MSASASVDRLSVSYGAFHVSSPVLLKRRHAQLLRSLQHASAARSRKSVKGGVGNHKGNRGGARTSHPGLLAKGGVTPSARAGAKFGSPPFSPPDAWDDTGLFTVAPRPKTVPSTENPKRNRRAHQKPTIETHTLADPVFSRPSTTPQMPLLPPSTGSLGGSAVVGTIPPGDLWHKGDDFGGGTASDGFGLWPKRRQKVLPYVRRVARCSLLILLLRLLYSSLECAFSPSSDPALTPFVRTSSTITVCTASSRPATNFCHHLSHHI